MMTLMTTRLQRDEGLARRGREGGRDVVIPEERP
jgi:hypothetical protein